MPKNKKQPHQTDSEHAIYKKITPGITPLTFNRHASSPKPMTPKELKVCRQRATDAKSYLDRPDLSADLQAQCLISLWLNLYAQYYHIYLVHQNAPIEPLSMQKLKSELDSLAGRYFDLLGSILSSPANPAIKTPTKHKLHPLLGDLLLYYCAVPTLFGIAILTFDKSRIETGQACLAESNSRTEQLDALIKEVTPILARQESHLLPEKSQQYFNKFKLTRQFELISILNSVVKKPLHDSLYPPLIPEESHARSSSRLVKELKTDPALSKLGRILENMDAMNAVTTYSNHNASSSSSSEGVSSLILSNDLDCHVIDAEFKKLMQCAVAPSFNQAMILTDTIRAWICAPERVSRLLLNLTNYVKKNFPEFERNKAVLSAEKEIPFKLLKSLLEEHKNVTHLILYFFNHLQNERQLSNSPVLYSLLQQAWDLRIPCKRILHLLDNNLVPNNDIASMLKMQSFYLASFESICPFLYKVMITQLLDKEVPGFDKEHTQFFKKNLDIFKEMALQFLEAQIISSLYLGEQEKAVRFCQLAQLFLQTGKLANQSDTNQELSQYWGTRFIQLEQLVKSPHEESFNLAKLLVTISRLVDLQMAMAKMASSETISSKAVYSTSNFRLLLENLQSAFARGSMLNAHISDLSERLPELMTQVFRMDPCTNLVNANYLHEIIQLIARHSELANLSQQLLVKQLQSFDAKLQNELPLWQEHSNRLHQPKIKQLFDLLRQDELEFAPIAEAKATAICQTYFLTDAFILTLDKALQTRAEKSSCYALATMAQLSSQNPAARFFQDKMLLKLMTLMSRGFENHSFTAATHIYSIWNQCLPACLQMLQRFNQDPASIQHFYKHIIQIKLDEAHLYAIHGQPDQALLLHAQAGSALENLANKFDYAELNLLQQELEKFGQELQEPGSPSVLLAWCMNPVIQPSESNEILPPEKDSADFSRQQKLRWQNAWQFLGAASQNMTSFEQIQPVYSAWNKHFKTIKMHPLTKRLLLVKWQDHFAHHAPSASSISSPVKFGEKMTRPKKEKTDWKKLRDERKIAKINQHNESRFNRLLAKKEQREAQRMLARLINESPEQEAILIPSEQEPVSTAHPEPEMIQSEQTQVTDTPAIMVDTEPKPIIRRPMTQPWVTIVKGTKINQSESSCSSSSSPEDSPVRYSLSPNYRHPPAAQKTLDTLNAAGYLAFVSDTGVRDILSGYNACHPFIVTNCPPEESLRLMPGLLFDKFTQKCHVLNPLDRIPVTIKYEPATSALELARTLHFTVNSFLVNAQRELIVPFEQAHIDLANKSFKTILPIRECFTKDTGVIWRIIEQSNRLGWSLDSETEATISDFAPKLCNFSIHQFIAHFKMCFATHPTLATLNFDTFNRLGLLPWVTSRSSDNRLLMAQHLRFGRDSLKKLFENHDDNRFLDTLVLFMLLNNQPSLDAYLQQFNQWIAPFEQREHNPLVVKSLKDALPDRLRHYYNKRLMNCFNPNAELFIPQSIVTRHGFMAPPRMTIPCSSRDIEPTGDCFTPP